MAWNKTGNKNETHDFCLILAMNEFLMSVIFAFFCFCKMDLNYKTG